jgi:hypothetical protein
VTSDGTLRDGRAQWRAIPGAAAENLAAATELIGRAARDRASRPPENTAPDPEVLVVGILLGAGIEVDTDVPGAGERLSAILRASPSRRPHAEALGLTDRSGEVGAAAGAQLGNGAATLCPTPGADAGCGALVTRRRRPLRSGARDGRSGRLSGG